MCINMVIWLQYDIIAAYQKIKSPSDLHEHFASGCYYPPYYWNDQKSTLLVIPLLVYLTNVTFIKSSMEPKYYKVVNTHDKKLE